MQQPRLLRKRTKKRHAIDSSSASREAGVVKIFSSRPTEFPCPEIRFGSLTFHRRRQVPPRSITDSHCASINFYEVNSATLHSKRKEPNRAQQRLSAPLLDFRKTNRGFRLGGSAQIDANRFALPKSERNRQRRKTERHDGFEK